MIRRNTWIVLVVFAVLLAATLLWQRSKQREDSAAEVIPATTESDSVLDIDVNQVAAVTLQDSEGNEIRVQRVAEDQWSMAEPRAEAVDVNAFETALVELLATRSTKTMDSSLPLEDMGLGTPSYRILLVLDDGDHFVLNVGKATLTGNGYYLLTSDRKIYVANKYSLDTFLRLLEEPPILSTPTPEATPEAGGAQEATATP